MRNRIWSETYIRQIADKGVCLPFAIPRAPQFTVCHSSFSSSLRTRFFLGSRPLLCSASDMIHCSCPLVERNSSAAHFSMAAIVSESTRRTKLLVLLSFFIFFICGFASGGLTAYCHLCPYSVFMFVQRSPVFGRAVVQIIAHVGMKHFVYEQNQQCEPVVYLLWHR